MDSSRDRSWKRYDGLCLFVSLPTLLIPPTPTDPLEQAWLDYFHTPAAAELILHFSDGTTDHCPVGEFFRDPEAFESQDGLALELCQGQILDIGAGCGNHCLYLQTQGSQVCALDRSPVAAWIMAQRGVDCIYQEDIFNFKARQFDTLLMLMNGIGLVGSLQGLAQFLAHCHHLLTPQGQILLDSTELVALDTDRSAYGGELSVAVEYGGRCGEPFPWLFVDPDTLERIAAQQGWFSQVLYLGPEGQYLARLIRAQDTTAP